MILLPSVEMSILNDSLKLFIKCAVFFLADFAKESDIKKLFDFAFENLED